MRRGLITRSDILENLKKDDWCAISEIVGNVSVTSSTVLYHLRNMEREEVVERAPDGRGWRFAPIQQAELMEFITKKARKK